MNENNCIACDKKVVKSTKDGWISRHLAFVTNAGTVCSK